MVRQSQVSQFEREANKVDEEVRCMDAPVDEDGTIDVGV
jgi:hypothetical protein